VVTNEQKQCILDQARELIARGENSDQKLPAEQQAVSQIDDRPTRPHFDPVRRSWPDGIPPDEPRPLRPKLDTSPVVPPVDWSAYIEQRMADEREFVFAMIGECQHDLIVAVDQLGQAIAKVHEQQGQKELARLEQLRVMSTKLEEAMQRVYAILDLHSQRQAIVDLPTPTRRSEVN
jgi:hypothetical protein